MKSLVTLSLGLLAISTICVGVSSAVPANKKGKSITAGWIQQDAPKSQSTTPATDVNVTVIKQKVDTVYCLSTHKKNSWLLPSGIISKDEIHNYQYIVRFTNRNKAGNYCSIEILDRDLNPNDVGFTTTIGALLPDSITKTSEIISSWSNAYRLDYVTDHTGQHVLQERMLDVNNRLLGYVTHTYQDDFQLDTEHYFGTDGLPARIGKSSERPLGLWLNILFDKEGNDSLVYLTDGQNVVPNRDDASYLQYTYSKTPVGRLVKTQRSLGSDFKPMSDRSGNCGFVTVYDKNLTDSISTYIDDKDNVIAMPEDTYDATSANVSTKRYHFNTHNLLDTISFYGVDGKPVENALGTHKIVTDYNSMGKEVLKRGYDLNGNPAPINEQLTSSYTVVWDSFRNVVEFHQYDRNGQPVSNGDTNSSYYNVYDSVTGSLISAVGYVYDADSRTEVLHYRSIYSALADSILYSDGTSKIVLRDSLGRTVSKRFFDKTGAPDTETYCAVDSTEYLSTPNGTITINTEYRVDGSVQTVCRIDSLAGTYFYRKYDTAGHLVDSYIHHFDKDGSFIGQSDCNAFGVPCRAGGTSDVRMFHVKVQRALDGSYRSFNVVDEFGEPDYLVDIRDEIYSRYGDNETRYNARVLRDEYGQEIPESEYGNMRDALAKAMSIEVTDSAAYRLGLRDNDLILQYGDYATCLQNPLSEDGFKKQWAVRSVLDARDVKSMVVFRIEDAATGKFGIVTIDSLQGTPSQLGFIPHVRYLTDRQRNRILNSAAEAGVSLPERTPLTHVGHTAVVGYPDMYRSRRLWPYQAQVIDASLLVGAIDTESGTTWSDRNRRDLNKLNDIIQTSRDNHGTVLPMPTYLFSTDGNTTIEIDNCGSLYDCYLNEADYAKAKALLQNTDDEIDNRIRNRNLLKLSDIAGYWRTAPGDTTTSMYDTEGYLYLDKNGQVHSQLSFFGYIPHESSEMLIGSPIFRIKQYFEGKYSIGQNTIRFTGSDKGTEEYECIDVVGDDAEGYDHDALTKLYTANIADNARWYNNLMTRKGELSPTALVKALDKQTMTLTDKNGNEVRFVRTKGKPEPLPALRTERDSLVGSWLSYILPLKVALSLKKDGTAEICLAKSSNASETKKDCGIALWAYAPGQWSVKGDRLSIKINWNELKIESKATQSDKTADEYEQILAEEVNKLKEVIRTKNFDDNLLDDFVLATNKNLKFRQCSFTKARRNNYQVYGEIIDADGYLARQGLSGRYVVLRWCDWTCGDTTSEFQDELKKQANEPKRIILLPVQQDSEGNETYGTPLEITTPAETLGIKFQSFIAPGGAYYMIYDTCLEMFEYDSTNK